MIDTRLAPGAILRTRPIGGRALHAAALLLAVHSLLACAPGVPSGGLASRPHRVTNEQRDADLAVIDGWHARLEQVAVREGWTTGRPAYAAAKAQAWLTFAREEYVAEPRDTTADAALAQARYIIAALERDSIPADVDQTTYVVGTAPVRQDLWAELAEVKARVRYPLVADEVAAAEVALVRSGRLGPAIDRAVCRADLHLERAQRLLADANERTLEVVASLPMILDSVANAPANDALAGRRQVTITVHFAVDRTAVSAKGRRILDSIIALMTVHPKLAVILEGHADPRGNRSHNLDLSFNRARSVRDYLVAAGIGDDRVTYSGYGSRLRAALGASAIDFASDRRVTLHFLAPEGDELTAGSRSDDLQVERGRSAGKRR